MHRLNLVVAIEAAFEWGWRLRVLISSRRDGCLMTFSGSSDINHKDTKTQSDYGNENKPCSVLRCLCVFVPLRFHDRQKTNFTCANKLNKGFFGSMITSSGVQKSIKF